MGFFSFGKKSADQPSGGAAAGVTASGAFIAQPDKARTWFKHGDVAAGTHNFDYALICYASGLKLDPTQLPIYDRVYELAIQYAQTVGKPASRENLKKIDGPGPIDKFVTAAYVWFTDLQSVDPALKMLDATSRAGQFEFGRWVAPKVLGLVRRAAKKPSKSQWIKIKDLFSAVEAYTEAFAAAEEAIKIDPHDIHLVNEIKQLTAARAMSQGGFTQAALAGEGGFRSVIRDADKQRQLIEDESIVSGEDSVQRVIDYARKEFETNPMSGDAITKLGATLRKQGTPESEAEALIVYQAGWERLTEYRFKMAIGEIKLVQLRRTHRAHELKVEAAPADADLKAQLVTIAAELLALELSELRDRQKNYPTDRGVKMDLGRLEFRQGNFQDAMACFQACKEDAKFRVYATQMLGRCFAAEGWHEEAVGEYRDALTQVAGLEAERDLSIRYDLMSSLIERAKLEKRGDIAREAAEICSAIVRKNIGYRDIRQKRKDIDALQKELPN
ncbi:MAG: hypothetical protein EXS10_09555 [Phycisphaerales bacterium]|nr:hypothetical protein [Phycisphaerales bacterium]